MTRLVLLLGFLSVVSGATIPASSESSDTKSPVAKVSVDPKDKDWWRNAVIYQIYVRSFQDSDGDGIGDLQGVINRLDYIKSLGVDAVWLSPIYPSGGVDTGYDPTNMKDIDKVYGTMAQFDILLKNLTDSGIQLIMDYVPNHTSDKHPWFSKSVAKEGKYAEYYVWRNGPDDKTPPNNWGSGFGGSAWKYNTDRKQFYLHQFDELQIDLNYENPDVVKEMTDIMEFWLQKGVAGFRMDAVFAMCEDQGFQDEPKDEPGKYTKDQDKTYEIIQEFRKTIDKYSSPFPRIMFTESYNQDFAKIAKYYGTTDAPGAHFPMNMFVIMDVNGQFVAQNWIDLINDYTKGVLDANSLAWPNWILGNHDQHRVASRLDTSQIDGLNMLNLLLKGTAITYMGEELGMTDGEVRWDEAQDPSGKHGGPAGFEGTSRDFERTPMQWNTSVSAGFSSSDNTWLPVNSNYWSVNMQAQNSTNSSHLAVYRQLVQLRKLWSYSVNDSSMSGLDVLRSHNNNTLVVIRHKQDNPSIIGLYNIGSEYELVNLQEIRPTLPKQLVYYTSSVNYYMNDTRSMTANGDLILFDTKQVSLAPKAMLVLTSSVVNLN